MMPRMCSVSSYGATACLLRLTVAIVCMKACATVAVILTASGAMKSNATEYPATKPFARHKAHGRPLAKGRWVPLEPKTSSVESSSLRNTVIKASAGSLPLQKVPSKNAGSRKSKSRKKQSASLLHSVEKVTSKNAVSRKIKSRKKQSASLLHSVDKVTSLLHSGDSQTPSTTDTGTTTTAVSTSTDTGTTTTASSTSGSTTTTVSTLVASGSTTTTAPTVALPGSNTTSSSPLMAVTDSPWGGQTPPPNALPPIMSTQGPSVLPGTLPPTPIPVPRWAQGGLATMHGCECSDSWQLNGLTLRGCVVSANVRMPWCVVKDPFTCKRGYTNSALPITATAGQTPGAPIVINGTWDFCTLPEDVDPHLTMASCHCLPLWEHGGVAYSGCNKTGDAASVSGTGQSWCYVAETGGNCAGARAPDATRLQSWDECDSAATEPSFLTKNSCHCKPRWAYKGKEYTSCIQDELVPAPAVLNTTNTSVKAELIGWCQVFEDERVCPNVELTDTGELWDTCFFLDEAGKAELVPTLHGCHCLPEWSLDGVLYNGCAWTPVAKASWCPVVEDESTCSNSLNPADTEFGAGRGRRRWDWCSVTKPKDPSQPWRLANERFVPKDPAPPAWYQNVYGQLKDEYGDWLDQRRSEQASFTGRRRRF